MVDNAIIPVDNDDVNGVNDISYGADAAGAAAGGAAGGGGGGGGE